MKKTLLLLAATCLLFSCTKDVKSCWNCTTTVSTGSSVGTSQTEICDKTATEIQAMENAARTTSTGTSYGYTVTSRTSMYCSKK